MAPMAASGGASAAPTTPNREWKLGDRVSGVLDRDATDIAFTDHLLDLSNN
jgi:hypothetical protein